MVFVVQQQTVNNVPMEATILEAPAQFILIVRTVMVIKAPASMDFVVPLLPSSRQLECHPVFVQMAEKAFVTVVSQPKFANKFLAQTQCASMEFVALLIHFKQLIRQINVQMVARISTCTVKIRQIASNFMRIVTSSALGYCYNGQQSQLTCSKNSDCGTSQICMNGLCCTTTGNEWQYACGGITAIASCYSDGTCSQSMVCTTSNYCCECMYGQRSGKCSNGCPNGYTCTANNYCCPQCSNGQTPYGTCYNGQCPSGYVCKAGNICCLS
uniref:Antifreeze protein n=1 Tax=Panagrolaimus sp. JU765 TaxID=591449 RepID=A0AC34Q289_9BILA